MLRPFADNVLQPLADNVPEGCSNFAAGAEECIAASATAQLARAVWRRMEARREENVKKMKEVEAKRMEVEDEKKRRRARKEEILKAALGADAMEEWCKMERRIANEEWKRKLGRLKDEFKRTVGTEKKKAEEELQRRVVAERNWRREVENEKE